MLNNQPGQMQMQLSELLQGFVKVSQLTTDPKISGIAIDSRQVKPGELFLAYCGETLDGHDFIEDAIKNGAVAVLAEHAAKVEACSVLPENIPVLVCSDLKQIISKLAARFYGNPAQNMTIIGVTGTNGKTSCTYFIAGLLRDQGVKCGIIGTIGAGFIDQLTPFNNTTPDVVSLQRWFFELKQQGAKAIAIEVSSHSLVQPHRTQDVDFDIAVFTNLTRDHLDYHGTLESYGEAKKRLFTRKNLEFAIINADDEFGRSLVAELKNSASKSRANLPKVFAYTINNNLLDVPTVQAELVHLDRNGISAKVIAPWGESNLHTSLWGKFNLSNIFAALTVLHVMGGDMKVAIESVKKLPIVPGRMQVMGGGHGQPTIVVDYAHTPDALEQTLLALREHCKGALWCIFGCGGDRDRGKRPLMGQIAERYSDHIIITNDNPRTEDSRQIIADIVAGLLCPWAVEIEPNRRVAITHAIDCAEANDVILIAGKGHENYQIIGKDKLPFSDVQIVEETIN